MNILDGRLVITGGFDTKGGKSTNTVEAFEFEAQRWTTLKNLNFDRFNHTGCVINSCIYLVGGYSNSQGGELSSIE